MCLQIFIHAFHHFPWLGQRGRWHWLFRRPHQVHGHSPLPRNFIYNPQKLPYLSGWSWFEFSIPDWRWHPVTQKQLPSLALGNDFWETNVRELSEVMATAGGRGGCWKPRRVAYEACNMTKNALSILIVIFLHNSYKPRPQTESCVFSGLVFTHCQWPRWPWPFIYYPWKWQFLSGSSGFQFSIMA